MGTKTKERKAGGFPTVKAETWDKVLEHCRKLDVEEGEGEEYIYSVRSTTHALTIWTRNGWSEGWHQSIVVGKPQGKSRICVYMQQGTAPPAFQWTENEIKNHVMQLVSMVAPEEGI